MATKTKKQKLTDTVKKMAKKTESKTDKDALKSLLLKDINDKKEVERLERVKENKNVMEVTVYTQKEIPLCKQMIDTLTEEGISFIEKSIEDIKEEWDNVILATNQVQLPTLVVNGEYLVANRDFKTAPQIIDVIRRIGKEGTVLPSVEIRTLEGFKNMANGFQQALMNLGQQIHKLDQKMTPIQQFIDKLKEEIESEDE